MAGRRYQRVRVAGPDAPRWSLSLAAALCWGDDGFAGGRGSGIAVPQGFELDRALAELAWRAHEHNIRLYWADYWRCRGFDRMPVPWAARVFDGEPQTEPPGDEWAADRWSDIESNVG